MSDLAAQITKEFIFDVKRRLFDECLKRIGLCLDQLTDEQVWWRPNESSNSIGNLVLHLNGNVRQWILSGVAGQADVRKRQTEFDQRTSIHKEKIWAQLQQTMEEVRTVLDKLSPHELVDRKPVQVYEESVVAMIVHVTEHFSYHTGQIAWITKMLTDEDLGFYKGVDLG